MEGAIQVERAPCLPFHLKNSTLVPGGISWIVTTRKFIVYHYHRKSLNTKGDTIEVLVYCVLQHQKNHTDLRHKEACNQDAYTEEPPSISGPWACSDSKERLVRQYPQWVMSKSYMVPVLISPKSWVPRGIR